MSSFGLQWVIVIACEKYNIFFWNGLIAAALLLDVASALQSDKASDQTHAQQLNHAEYRYSEASILGKVVYLIKTKETTCSTVQRQKPNNVVDNLDEIRPKQNITIVAFSAKAILLLCVWMFVCVCVCVIDHLTIASERAGSGANTLFIHLCTFRWYFSIWHFLLSSSVVIYSD